MCDVKEIVVGRWGMEKRMEIGRVYLLNPATAVGDKFNPARKVYETRVRVCVCVCVCSVVQSCPTLCDPMDCSLLGSSVHGIFLARILEWISISFSRGSSRPRDQTHIFLHW